MNLNGLFSFLNTKDKSVLGIDIGSSAIKVVQLKKKKGRAVLETYGELALGPYGGVEVGRATSLSTDKISEAMGDLLKEAKTTTKSCGITIPLASSFVTFIKMPALDEKQLAQMIPIEARKYIPVPINEVLLDWQVIPKDGAMGSLPKKEDKNAPKEDVDVLVVVIHHEAIQKYSEVVQKNQLQSSFYEIEIFSTIRAALDHSVQSQMILDVGAGTTKLYIIDKGVLRYSHTINRGSQDITLAISNAMGIPVPEAENLKRLHGLSGGPEFKELTEIISLTLDYIFYESNRVLLNFEKKYNKSVGKVVLTGGGSLLKGFKELATTSFQTDAVLGDPFAKVETPAFLEDVLKQAGPEFAVAVGAALRKLSDVQ